MHRRSLRKPDGRALHLYSRAPLPDDLDAPGPTAGTPRSHLRWHPLRGEWVIYATHRQARTFLPPPAYNPLRPTTDPTQPTEVPAGPWEVAVFDNLFPALSPDPGAPPPAIVETAPGRGACEVVVFTQDPDASLGALPLARIDLILEVWGERWRELGARDGVRYVLAFENRGVEVGVTLHHPHGQIYAYPFVPSLAQRQVDAEVGYFGGAGESLLAGMIREELRDGRRVLYRGEHAVAFVPACARYAYEVWVAPIAAAPSLAHLGDAARADLARALKTVLRKYDALWARPFPYILACKQAPTAGEPHPGAHALIELYPPYRMPGRLKYLAGTEIGAGVFAADTLPEDKAAELRAVEVDVDA
jgi:UDPglucose--hexose-1-phosphate uridylyltransferase